ncbi:hypothetical protein [Nocardioides sp. T2.26MG-1]|uniref:hypothetical protein n=1 Tax=Nocardioides sp. T2.26MG-1 TaxID=3041166 RepID=UPI002540A3A0|nr:hypothetical protein [Nocardioides sp. T2.26MG-1]
MDDLETSPDGHVDGEWWEQWHPAGCSRIAARFRSSAKERPEHAGVFEECAQDAERRGALLAPVAAELGRAGLDVVFRLARDRPSNVTAELVDVVRAVLATPPQLPRV